MKSEAFSLYQSYAKLLLDLAQDMHCFQLRSPSTWPLQNHVLLGVRSLGHGLLLGCESRIQFGSSTHSFDLLARCEGVHHGWMFAIRFADFHAGAVRPSIFFPKQLTVGVLNATLDLAALVLVGVVGFLGSEVVLFPVVSGCLPSCGGWVLVGVVGFLGSEVVLSPVVSGCLPSCGGWVLVGVVGFLGSEVVLSPVVSHSLRLSPFMWRVGVGWCGRLLGL